MCAIVKNEEKTIERCMRSFAPVLDCFLIVDTGSTDATMDVIRKTAKELEKPLVLVERPWVSFGHNRTESLNLCRDAGAEYAFSIDADDTLWIDPSTTSLELTADGYVLDIDYGSMTFKRLQIMRCEKDWRFVGVLHEYPHSDKCQKLEVLHGIRYVCNPEGARSQDPAKYLKDIETLKKGLVDEPDNERYQFYLAQSYRDAGLLKEAHENYYKRAKQGKWAEEVYISLLEAAKISERLGADEDNVVDHYLQADKFRPTRCEALWHLIRYLIGRGYGPDKWGVIDQCRAARTGSNDVVFIEPHCYGPFAW